MSHTLLALVGVAQLLESAADLLGGSMFTGLFEDVLRYEAVSVGESAERFGSSGVGGLITGEALSRKGEMRVEITREMRDAPSNKATSRYGGQTASVLPLSVFQLLRPVITE